MVITDVNQVVYQGDGVTTAFPFAFRIIDATDIKLLLIDADGAETDITSDFFVDTVNNTVHYPGYAPGAEPPEADRPAPVQTGQKLVIYRELPITQEKDLGDKWPFFVIELALDKLTMILQQIYGWWGRAFKISEGTEATHPDFDLNVPIEAGKTFRVNDAGTGFEVTDDPKEAREAAEAAQAAAEDAAEAAEQALEDTRQLAVEPVYYYFNPHNLALENAGASAHMNECNIIRINNKFIMIDTGGWGWTTATKNYLESIGVTHIDYLIISHYHGDHAGGLQFMDYLDWTGCIAYLPPSPTYAEVNAESANIEFYRQQCVDFLNSHGVEQIIQPAEGTVVTIDTNLTIKMLNCDPTAFADIYSRQQARIAVDSDTYEYYYNDYSLVALVQHGNAKVVYSGDLMQVAEERMLDNKFYQNIDVYKMNHHGINFYGSAEYANSLNPKIVTVQNAQNWNDSYLNNRVIFSETQYYIDKTLLYPFDYVAVLASNKQSVYIISGKETYLKKNIDKISLSSNVSRILAGSDLNDYMQGTYSIRSGADVTSCANSPSDWSYGNARLIAFRNLGSLPSDGAGCQLLVSSASPGVIYVRTYSAGTWSAWKKLFSSGNVMTDSIVSTAYPVIKTTTDESFLSFVGGSDVGAIRGGKLNLYGSNNATLPGGFELQAGDVNNHFYQLVGKPDGTLTWGNNAIALAKDYLPLAGGTMTGTITTNNSEFARRSVDTAYLRLRGGTSIENGAWLVLYGKDHATQPGQFVLRAVDGSSYENLLGKPDGTLTWGGKPILYGQNESYDNNGFFVIQKTNTVIQWRRTFVSANTSYTWTYVKPFANNNYMRYVSTSNTYTMTTTATTMTVTNTGSSSAEIDMLAIGLMAQ